MRRRQLKNAFAEAMQFRNRALVAFAAVTLALLGLGGWYFRLQVLEHDEYATRSEANRIKPRPVVPGRGLILDRKGRVLAENVPAFRLDVVPDEAGDTKLLIANLSKIVALDPEDIERFDVERKARHGWRAITLKLRVGEEEAARFAVDRWRYPGVELVPYLNRRYPYGPELAHIIGYVGRIDQADLAKMGEVDAALTHTGKTGLERYYEDALRGKVGYEKIETNVEGRALRRLGQVPAVPGADLRLSIDLDLQRAMVAAFEDHDGSAVAIDPRTGEILAMVSLPSYDPNLFVNGISHTDYKALMDDPSRPIVQPQRARRRPAGFDGQAADRARGPGQRPAPSGRRGVFHRRIPHPGPAPRLSRCARRRGLDRPAQVDRRVGELLLLQARLRHGHRSLLDVHAQVRLRRAVGHRPGRRDQRHRAVAGMEAEAFEGKLVSRRNRDRGHRAGRTGSRRRCSSRAALRRSPMADASCGRTWLRRAAMVTTRRGCRSRSPKRRTSPTTPPTCAPCRKA